MICASVDRNDNKTAMVQNKDTFAILWLWIARDTTTVPEK